MKKWVKVIRDKIDQEHGYQLCPICKGDTLELLQDESDIHLQERCAKGCYVYVFDLQKRIK